MGNKTFSINDISKFNRQLGPKEKIICLLGETGNGKSTFINQITNKNEYIEPMIAKLLLQNLKW